jgi:hypothetical protein
MSLYPKRDASADCTEKAHCIGAMLRGRDEPTLGQAEMRSDAPIISEIPNCVRNFLRAELSAKVRFHACVTRCSDTIWVASPI